MIEVLNYQKAYDNVLAVDGLSVQVPSGCILGLVGPNGAGKTTTMRAIAGIIPPTRGRLLVSGYDVVTQPKEAKQRVAFVPDEPKLFESLTVWEHLKFVGAAYQITNWVSLAESLVEQFDLTERRDALAQQLSRGMKQKVAICCAYLQQPTAIMFDEPHTGLDPMAIRTMKTTVRERAADGAAIIVSSHLLDLIEDLCTHLLILDRGRSRFCGSLSVLQEEYPELAEGSTLEEVFFKATSRNTSTAPGESSIRVSAEPDG